MNDATTSEKRADFKFEKISEDAFESSDNSTNVNQSLVLYKDTSKSNRNLKYHKSSPLDYIDLKYVKHSSTPLANANTNSTKSKARAFSQLGSETSFRSSTERSFNSSLLLKNPYNSLNATPRTLADAFRVVSSRPQLNVEYINIVSDASLIPKYLSSTVKLESLKRDDCDRNFGKTNHEILKTTKKGEHLPVMRRSTELVRKPTALKLYRPISKSKSNDKSHTKHETSIIYYIEQINQPEINRKSLSTIEEKSKAVIDLQSTTNIHRIQKSNTDDLELVSRSLAETRSDKTNDSNDYEESHIRNRKKVNDDYSLVNIPKINKEDSFLNYNFSIQRTESEYETFNAIKKRVKFFEKIDYYDYANTKRTSEKEPDDKELEINKLSLTVPQIYHYNIANNTNNNNNKHLCIDVQKKKKKEKKLKNEVIIEEDANTKAASETSDDAPLLESYKEIINRSIERNKKLKEKKQEEEKLKAASAEIKPVIKYKYLLDKLVDNEKDAKLKREHNNHLSKMKKISELDSKTIDYNDEDSLLLNDAKLSAGENWLLKWSILKNVSSKNLVEIFKKNDFEKRGYILGESLRTAIQMTCSMTNLKLSYLYSVLSLCGIEGANLKVFNIIISLALKVNHLDDEWFKNLLPQLDLSSVENKVFKALNMWKYLVNPKTKTFSIYELMIEFEAGCVSREHIEYAKKKFANRLYFDITDYLTYIPLFLYIHDRIIRNPFFVASKQEEI